MAKLENGKYFIVSFVEFQYGKVSTACPAHKPVLRALEKNRLSIPYQYPISDRVQEKDKDKEEVQEEETEGPPKLDPAEAIYAAYPKKSGKQEALKFIRLALKTVPFGTLLSATAAYAAAVAKWAASEMQFVPDPERWYRKGRWDDEPSTWARAGPADTATARLEASKHRTVQLTAEEQPDIFDPMQQ